MNYITTTDLRTESSNLINALKKGESITLVHRSQVVGVIKPAKNQIKPLTSADIMELRKLAEKLNLSKKSYKERENIYRKGLEKKYGKSIS